MDINQSVSFEIIKMISVFGGDDKLTFKTAQMTIGQRRNVYNVAVGQFSNKKRKIKIV